MANITGVESNHSSTVRSTSHSANADHPQFDDILDNVPPPQDHSISGTPEMSPLHDPMSGRMNGWEENDCYRDFFFTGVAADSRIYGADMDPDFDSNGGIPTKFPRADGFQPDRSTSIGTVITRRI